MAILKAQSGVEVAGRLKYADVAAGQYGEQIKLAGEFNGEPKANIYLPMSVRDQLIQLGLIDPQPTDKDGRISHKVRGQPQIKILPTGDGTARRYTVTLAGGAPPVQNGTNGHAPQSNGARQQQQNGEPPAVRFARLVRTATRCVEEAKKAWEAVFPELAPDKLAEMAGPTASSLFIACDKAGCLAPPPAGMLPPPPKMADICHYEKIDELGQKLRMPIVQMKAIVKEITKADDPMLLTEAQAKIAIADLEDRLVKFVAELAAQAQQPATDSYDADPPPQQWSADPGGDNIPF